MGSGRMTGSAYRQDNTLWTKTTNETHQLPAKKLGLVAWAYENSLLAPRLFSSQLPLDPD